MPYKVKHTDKSNYLTSADLLAAVLQRNKINSVLDVGANKGQFGKQLRKIQYYGAIHSFEPVRSTYTELVRSAAGDDLWHTYPLALGAGHESRTMKLANDSGYSSFLSASQTSQNHFGSEIETIFQETVQVSTLDGFCSANQSELNNKNIFLKMDTQGYDLEVISGAKESIGRITGIRTELAFKPLYENAPNHLETFKTFEELGFRVAGIYPTHRDSETLTLLEADCFFLNTTT